MQEKPNDTLRIVDIHSHILPRVDDGASSLDESLEMLASEQAQGAAAVVLTPHYGIENGYAPLAENVEKNFRALKAAASVRFPGLGLYLGSEVFCTPDAEERVERGLAHSMADTRYVLFEFANWGDSHESAEMIAERMLRIAANGRWCPILAHAERYIHLHNRRELFREMADAGVCLQVNAYDLSESSEDNTRSCAQWLVQNQLAHFLGTDGHRMNRRPPALARGAAWVRGNCPPDYADALLFGNAERMLLAGPTERQAVMP